MSFSDTTIFALSSAAGRAGVSVIRISGPDTENSILALCNNIPRPRYASLKKIYDPENHDLIDEGLVLWFPGPSSFTGEDCAELQVHGGIAVIDKILATLSSLENFRMADPGEFARRAFENGKLDLTRVEGLADLINAETENQRKQAVIQSAGSLGMLYENWRGVLVQSMTLMTAAIDFSDEEDIADDILKPVKPLVRNLYQTIQEHLNDGHRGEILRDGYQVVIAGVPNVGKSSLLNALARRDAAIVSDEEGTTRDIIQVSLDLRGYPILVTDTAGLRQTTSTVEREGIKRTFSHANDAAMVIWLMDARCPVEGIPDEFCQHNNILKVVNKIDIDTDNGVKLPSHDLAISIKKNIGVTDLIAEIGNRVSVDIGNCNSPVITRQRYRTALETSCYHMKTFLDNSLDDNELRAEDLRLAANEIGKITGQIDIEDLLDHLFSEFCIGK